MVIKFENVEKAYDIGTKISIPVIKNLSFEIQKGDFLVIKGPSGCGKTTVLRLISGLTSCKKGKISVVNNPLNEMNQEQLALFRSAYLGIVFQDFQLIKTLTCLENVMLPLELAGASSMEAQISAELELQIVGLDHRFHHYPVQLSGGEQQRTTWARAFVNQPSLVLADEPTANLDYETQQFIFEGFKKIKKDFSLTTVVATHESNIEKLATCILHFEDYFKFKRIAEAPEQNIEVEILE